MKKKIMFGLISLLSLNTIVSANELVEPISSIVKNGTLYVDTTIPTTDEEFKNTESVLNEQYKEYLTDDEKTINKRLYLADCSSDYLTCNVIYESCLVGEGCGGIPTEVKMKWKEVYSDTFNLAAPNGILELNAVKPHSSEELDYYVNVYSLKVFLDDDFHVYINNVNDDMTEGLLTLSKMDESSNWIDIESHVVQLKWKTEDSLIKNTVNSYIKNMEDTRPEGNENPSVIYYDLIDLSKINYMNYLKSSSEIDVNNYIKYIPDIKKIFVGSNIDLYLDVRAGDYVPMYKLGFGGIVIYYNDIMYGVVDSVGIIQKNVIYIPDETEDTSDAYIAAAKKRIDEYLGNTETKIEVAGTLDSIDTYFSKLGDKSKMGKYYYNVTVGEVTEEFVFIKDSSKIETPTYNTKDIRTNVSVSTKSSEVPLDTVVKVEEVKNNSEEFRNINLILKIENEDEMQVYDIKLYSESSSEYITKLENGKFEVSLPIKDSLKGKKLVAYYINEKGEIEEHDVTVVDGVATFTTDHFSVYTIAEKNNNLSGETVPPTGDNIMIFICIGLIGLIGLGTSLVLRKREN